MTDQPQQEFDPKPQHPDLEEPSHPDYQHILGLLLDGIDQAASHPDFDIEAYVAQYVDSKSLAHLSLQRAMLGFKISNPLQLGEMMPTLMAAAALYLEAFVLGVQYTQGGTETDILAGVLRKALAEEEFYSDLRSYDQGGLEIVLDGHVALEPAEHAVLDDILHPETPIEGQETEG